MLDDSPGEPQVDLTWDLVGGGGMCCLLPGLVDVLVRELLHDLPSMVKWVVDLFVDVCKEVCSLD